MAVGQHVFISNWSKDVESARRICRVLESRGLACWMARRDVAPGENFQAAITEAIELAYAMVLVFSSHADAAAQEIKKEVVLAGQSNLVVVPVRLENLLPSDKAFRYELSTRQWVDLFDDWENGLDRIVAHLQRVMPKSAAAV